MLDVSCVEFHSVSVDLLVPPCLLQYSLARCIAVKEISTRNCYHPDWSLSCSKVIFSQDFFLLGIPTITPVAGGDAQLCQGDDAIVLTINTELEKALIPLLDELQDDEWFGNFDGTSHFVEHGLSSFSVINFVHSNIFFLSCYKRARLQLSWFSFFYKLWFVLCFLLRTFFPRRQPITTTTRDCYHSSGQATDELVRKRAPLRFEKVVQRYVEVNDLSYSS